MHSHFVTPAIVLRSWPFGESDKIVSFFTKDFGKVTGIAKGAKRSRKRFVNSLELFSLVNLRFQDRPHNSLAFVHACDLIRVFKDLCASLEKIAHVSYLVEITDGLTGEREENQSLFEHLKQGLIFVEEKGPSLLFLIFFQLKLIKLSGYEPVLEHCRRCRKSWKAKPQTQWCFSPRDGGILCEPCSTFRKETIPLSLEALYALVNFQKAKAYPTIPPSFPPSVLKEGHSVLFRFIQFQLGKELKSAPFLDAFSFT